ncbi:hypothetical protein GmHk_14G041767 [Glycine max]|nr:hypothetical protein GmHk_14G041767 [Glycine max]
MTISQYYGWASINQQQLAEIIGSLKEDRRNEIIGNLKEEVRNEIEEENKRSLEKMKHELKDAIKIEFSQRGSQYSPLIEANIHDSHISPKKLAKPVQRLNNVAADDPLHHLIKSLYDIYEKPIELMWDGTKFGIPNIDASFFLTYSDVNEIISGLWMTGAQVWVMVRCIDSLSLSRYTIAMKTLKTTVGGENNQGTPKWIEVKWFGDGTTLDIETITTIHKKWAAYFVKVKNIRCRKV